MNKAMREWADEVVASGENAVHGENDVSVRIVRMLADNPGILANVRDALLYAEVATGLSKRHSVEIVIYEITESRGEVEYSMEDEYPLTAFSEYEEAREYADALVRKHTVYKDVHAEASA